MAMTGLCLGAARSALSAEESPGANTVQVQRLFAKYCWRCHTGDNIEGEIDLAALKYSKVDTLPHRVIWTKALAKLRDEDMPPTEPLPTQHERKQMADWLGHVLGTSRTPAQDPGHVTLPRLTRAEYANTMRDLLGIELDFTARLDADAEGESGFENDRDALSITPAQMEKYFANASWAVDKFLQHQAEPLKLQLETEQMFMTEQSSAPAEFGYVLTRGQMTLYDSVKFPMSGRYRFTVRAWSTAGLTGARLRIEDVQRGDIVVPHTQPGEYQLDCHVDAGTWQVAWNIQRPAKTLVTAIREDADSASTAGPSRGRRLRDAAVVPRHAVTKKSRSELRPNPETPGNIAIDWIRIEGPIMPDTERHSSPVYVTMPSGKLSARDAARETLHRFTMRAYRRPVLEAEVERLVELFDRSWRRQDTYLQALKLPLAAVLVSPQFLYRVESAEEPEHAFELDDYQIASRLSYFLWLSMPDDELFRLAAQRRLRDPETLREQASRMLADPRSQRFTSAFADQWLGIHTLTPDAVRFPEFTDSLRNAMQEETRHFVDWVIREDRSLLEFVQSKHTFLNAELADHYDLAPLKGDQLRLVTLPDASQRGGLLGMGSVLTGTSLPLRTSPVRRGKWVLETLFGQTLPPPPDNAGELPDDTGALHQLTLRERFEKHRQAKQCQGCHDRIDPIGFGLENFDAIGRWRNMQGGKVIDNSGRLPSGETFAGARQLGLVLQRREFDFAENFTRRMLRFALGRQLQYYDQPAVDRITTSVKEHNYRASAVIDAIVTSYPFLNQRSAVPIEERP